MDHSQNHRNFWHELDALVLAEVEALDPPAPQVEGQAPPEEPPDLCVPEASADVEENPHNLDMFDGEEQEVIARTSAWLRDRPNRDMIIDALWSAVAGGREPDSETPKDTSSVESEAA